MPWKLWIDDQYDDPHTPNRHPTSPEFKCARNVEEAIELVKQFGLPSFMQLDHDLGDTKVTSFLYWLANEYSNGPIPDYEVHSRNPEGKKNAISIIESWRKSNEDV